jgi:diaminopimelate epimerase
MQLSKFHGLGNDFLIVLESQNPGLVPDPGLARALCARRVGFGADGLIFGMAPVAADVDVQMVLFNSDGTEAELSGNGLRCLAHAVSLANGGATQVVAATKAGLRPMVLAPTEDPRTIEVEVDMGEPAAGPPIPVGLEEALRDYAPVVGLATVDMGNPHLVVHVPSGPGVGPTEVDLAAFGRMAESFFADGINVHLIEPDGESGLRLRVWERGAGITEACGSGACAAAVAASDWGLTAPTVRVHMPGGSATVRISDRVLLTGPSTHIGEVQPHEEGP